MNIGNYAHKPFFLPGNNTALIFIHGFTASPTEVYPTACLLHNNTGCTISGILLPGHGSDESFLRQTTWHDWFAAVVKEYKKLSEKYTHIYIAGLSMGGLLSLYSGIKLPGLKGVVSINAPIITRYPLLTKLAPAIKKFAAYFPKNRSDDDLEAMGRFAYKSYPVEAFCSMQELKKQVLKNLSHLGVPVLLIQSLKDRAVNPDSVNYLRKRMPGEVKVVLLEQSHHVATMETEIDIISSEISKFMKKP